MKNINNRVIFFPALLVLTSLILSACGKMDDIYSEFLEDGATLYVAKADSIELMPGRNRVQLSWLLLSDPKVRHYKVYWDNRRDSLEKQVQKTETIDTIRVEINDLGEGTQTFEIYAFDELGNKSVKAEISGKVYGDRYESSLLNATIAAYLWEEDDLKVIWNENQPEGLSVIDLEYTDLNNTLIKQSFTEITDTLTLPKFPEEGSFRYRSGFLPDSLAIDTFYADYTTVEVGNN